MIYGNMDDYKHQDYVGRNDNGNLNGTIECPICNKTFSFEENVNSDGVVHSINIIRTSQLSSYSEIVLDMVSKCPHCKYKFKHQVTEKNTNPDIK
ncbi:DUF2225 domain-containing protein [Clostridium butyricum]